jgi:hypothetical protein
MNSAEDIPSISLNIENFVKYSVKRLEGKWIACLKSNCCCHLLSWKAACQ